MSGSAIPAGQIVNVVPSVLNAGGIGLDLLGLLVTSDNHVPMDQVYSFPDLTSVQAFFGPTSYISALAGTYFLADINSTKRPGALLIATWSGGGWMREAWLRSASLPTLTLAQIQAIQPTSQIQLMMDGVNVLSAPIALAGATSFSMAAQIIGAALPYYGYPYIPAASGTISGTTLTIVTHGTVGGNFQPGTPITGTGIPANTYIISGISTTDNWMTGKFLLNRSLNITTPITIKGYVNCCTWDAASFQFTIRSAPYGSTATYPATGVSSMSHLNGITGNLAGTLRLAQSTGAILQPLGMGYSAGSHIVDSSDTFMDRILTLTQNWATFTTDFDLDAVGVSAWKQTLASWTNRQRNNYLYCAWDVDPAPKNSPNASSSLGRILSTNLTSGTVPISTTSITNGRNLAMFTMGTIAAIDFARLNGRKTLAFRGQTGIVPEVTSGAVAANLESNFYNYYGIWTTANDLFRFIYPGLVSGPYRWVDSYINQIWMNNGFQLALMDLLTQAGSIPYNQSGYTLIKAACQDVINQAVDFGAIRPGVTMSEAQKVEVNTMAGLEIDRVLTAFGYYLQVNDPAPQVRVDRGTPPMTFWYMDGGSIQRLTLASVMVQ